MCYCSTNCAAMGDKCCWRKKRLKGAYNPLEPLEMAGVEPASTQANQTYLHVYRSELLSRGGSGFAGNSPVA